MIFLTTEQKILDKTPLDKNLLSANLKPAIILSQKIQVTQLVGDRLINKIYTDIQNNTLSGDYKTLVDDYLTDMVVYWSVYYALTDLLSSIGNRGLQVESSETSASADISRYRELRSNFRNIAETFSERATDWLWKNSSLFPEFELCNSEGKVPSNINTKYFGGIQL
jgi:hypothetical protein